MREYPMTVSRGVWVVSGLATATLLAVPLLVWGAIPGLRLSGQGEVARWAVLLAPLVALASWAWAPRGLEIDGGELRILRRAWRAAAIPLSEVETVTRLPDRWLLGAVRTFGNGGLFGFYGWYFKKGPFRLYATRWRGPVEIVAAGRRVVVSPDEPDRFVEGLLALAPHARAGQVDGGAQAGGADSAIRRS